MICTGGIQLGDIARMEIYENTRKENMRKVWDRMKPDVLLNGPFFSWDTFSATCHMKIHGKVVCNPGYGEWGFGWNDGEAPTWCKLPCDKQNYFTNTVLVVGGKKRAASLLTWHKDADGTPKNPRYTSRPALGFKDTRFMYNGNSGGVSLPGMQNTLSAAGWTHGVMGDGGGSTMFKSKTQEIYSGRIIPYFILIYLKPKQETEPKGDKPMVTINAFSLKNDGGKNLSANFQVKNSSATTAATPFWWPRRWCCCSRISGRITRSRLSSTAPTGRLPTMQRWAARPRASIATVRQRTSQSRASRRRHWQLMWKP